jgi:hypothetical protein
MNIVSSLDLLNITVAQFIVRGEYEKMIEAHNQIDEIITHLKTISNIYTTVQIFDMTEILNLMALALCAENFGWYQDELDNLKSLT